MPLKITPDGNDPEVGAALNFELQADGGTHRYVPLLLSVPGVSWVLAYTIAAEIGDITRFPTPTKLCGYTGLCPKVYQSDRRVSPRARVAQSLRPPG